MMGEQGPSREELRAHLEALDNGDIGCVEIWEKLSDARAKRGSESVEADD